MSILLHFKGTTMDSKNSISFIPALSNDYCVVTINKRDKFDTRHAEMTKLCGQAFVESGAVCILHSDNINEMLKHLKHQDGKSNVVISHKDNDEIKILEHVFIVDELNKLLNIYTEWRKSGGKIDFAIKNIFNDTLNETDKDILHKIMLNASNKKCDVVKFCLGSELKYFHDIKDCRITRRIEECVDEHCIYTTLTRFNLSSISENVPLADTVVLNGNPLCLDNLTWEFVVGKYGDVWHK